MPAIDMPLEQLRKYKGISPCPDDIDAFWDEAVEEMKAVHPKLVMNRAAFQCGFADCFDMYFDGVGGARIYEKYVKQKVKQRSCWHSSSIMGTEDKAETGLTCCHE